MQIQLRAPLQHARHNPFDELRAKSFSPLMGRDWNAGLAPSQRDLFRLDSLVHAPAHIDAARLCCFFRQRAVFDGVGRELENEQRKHLNRAGTTSKVIARRPKLPARFQSFCLELELEKLSQEDRLVWSQQQEIMGSRQRSN